MNKIGPDHYRYEANLDEAGVTVHVQTFVVVGETPRCYYVVRKDYAHWAKDWKKPPEHLKQHRKRVLKASFGRRYCYPSKAHALDSFKQRQRWRIAHAKLSLALAELSLSVVVPALESLATVAPLDKYLAGQNDYTRSLSWDVF